MAWPHKLMGQKNEGKRRCQPSEAPSEMIPTQLVQFTLLKRILEYLDLSPPKSAFVARIPELQKLLTLVKKVASPSREGHIVEISGQPGVGKTYTVLHLLDVVCTERCIFEDFLSKNWTPSKSVINGAMIHGPAELFRAYLECLISDSEQIKRLMKIYKSVGVKESIEELCTYKLTSDNSMRLIVIDEEDQLCSQTSSARGKKVASRTTTEDVLKHLKDASIRCGQLLIIISNLTNYNDRSSSDKVIPKSCKTRLVFDPYEEHQLREILDERVQLAKNCLTVCSELSCHFDSILYFDPFATSAKSFTLKKIAAEKGDCRELLNTCRELICQQLATFVRQKQRRLDYYPSLLQTHYTCLEDDELFESATLLSTIKDKDVPLDDELARIQLQSTVQSLNSKSSDARCLQLLHTLPLHNQILLCSTCTAIQRGVKPLSVYNILTQYKEICSAYEIPMEYKSYANIVESLSCLETVGVIRLVKSKSMSRKKALSPFEFNRLKGPETSIEICFNFDTVCEILKECKQIFRAWLRE